MSQIVFNERLTDPGIPAAGKVAVFAKDNILFIRDDTGLVTSLVSTIPGLHAPSHQLEGIDELDVEGLSGVLVKGQNGKAGWSGYLDEQRLDIPANGVNVHMAMERFVHDPVDYGWTDPLIPVNVINTGRYYISGFLYTEIVDGSAAGIRRVEFGVTVDGDLESSLAGAFDVGGQSPANGGMVAGEIDLTGGQTVSMFASRLTGVGTVRTLSNKVGLNIRRIT